MAALINSELNLLTFSVLRELKHKNALLSEDEFYVHCDIPGRNVKLLSDGHVTFLIRCCVDFVILDVAV